MDRRQTIERPETDATYIPGLYEASSADFNLITEGDIESCLFSFVEDITELAKELTTLHPHYNLTKPQWELLKQLCADKHFIICLTDKNLGPAIIERTFSGDVKMLFMEASLGNSMLKEPANAISRDNTAKNKFTKFMPTLTIMRT